MSLGATDFFVKPLDWVSLLARIDRTLAESNGQDDRAGGRDEAQVLEQKTLSYSPHSASAGGSSTPFQQHRQRPVYAALALTFTADSLAALKLLEAVFTFVERTVDWAANKRFEISKSKFNSRELELMNLLGLVLGCIEAKIRK